VFISEANSIYNNISRNENEIHKLSANEILQATVVLVKVLCKIEGKQLKCSLYMPRRRMGGLEI